MSNKKKTAAKAVPKAAAPAPKAVAKAAPKAAPKQAAPAPKAASPNKAASGKMGKQAAAAPVVEEETEEEEVEWSDDEDDEAHSGGDDDDEEMGEDDEGFSGDDEEEEGEEGEDEEDDAALGAMLQGEMAGLMKMIASMKEQAGPIVTVVQLHANGTATEETVDMSPRLNALATMLGGKLGFVGQYPNLSATIMMRKEQELKPLPVNKHVLPAPFDQDAGSLRGDLLLVRMDEDTTPINITLAEYEAFKSGTSSPKKKKGGKQAPVAAAATPAPTPLKAKASGKKLKQGMTTEEAVALITRKRKSLGMPEPPEKMVDSDGEPIPQPKKQKHRK